MYSFSQQFGLFIHVLTPPIALWIFSALLAIVLLYANKKGEALVFLSSLIATTTLVWVAKLVFAVPRPIDSLIAVSTYAFPSGHAASGALLAVILSWLHIKRRKMTTAVLLTVCTYCLIGFLIGYSRVLIGVHTPFQVFMGFFIGTVIPLCSIWIYKKNYFPFLGK